MEGDYFTMTAIEIFELNKSGLDCSLMLTNIL